MLQVESGAQGAVVDILQSVPGARYDVLDPGFARDSSAHPRTDLVRMCDMILDRLPDANGAIVIHGTDTMDLAAATMALAGNARIDKPVVFLGSIRDQADPESDAPGNSLAAGLFLRYGTAGGVMATRPNGRIITHRTDTAGSAADWHTRDFDPRRGTCLATIAIGDIRPARTSASPYFSRSRLERMLQSGKLIEYIADPSTGRRFSIYSISLPDWALDTADQRAVFARGSLPTVPILGFERKPLQGSGVDGMYGCLKETLARGVAQGTLAHDVIPSLAIIENYRRTHSSKESHLWQGILRAVLYDHGVGEPLAQGIVDFWSRHADQKNTCMDFRRLKAIDGISDPDLLRKELERTQPSGIVIRATGSAGLRTQEVETYLPFLDLCRSERIPAVLTSCSGEVTAFEYGPPRTLFEEGSVFFAGTMGAYLVMPRLALVNGQKEFLEGLIGALDTSESVRRDMRWNVYRQLLTGTHFAACSAGALSDRARMQSSYGIETRVDVIGGFPAPQAVLATVLNEALRSGTRISPERMMPYLSR